ncbi:hypothetical protein SKTS_18200 [Sulfurimicrobium lacus]|uniref:Uncharacterized protein n=1 Tax=Sulfurimicrobium lacus TaxID=2715678 RepID=A0A6F8VB97_9PROT|nr:hypothetical protein [Sulfurimicrobium lacus]BCB26934.1 hypothetical protein SKTS_18200 [Sulfurimicrobium lacus]
MKKMYSILVACCLSLSFNAFAGSGKAIVPMFGADTTQPDWQRTNIFLSNITTHALNVQITVYQEDGTVVPSSSLTYVNFQNSNTQIGAGKSAYLKIDTVGWHFGYAIVQWQNSGTDQDAVGLVGAAQRQQALEWGHYIPVNNGIPF